MSISSGLRLAALDIGASGGRAVLGSLNGGKLDLSEVHRFENGGVLVGDRLYWDVLRIFGEMKTSLGKARALGSGDIAGVGIDTWGTDYAMLGTDDELLRNPYHYRDSRTQCIMRDVLTRVSRWDIYQQTGIQFMPVNSLYQLIATARHSPWLLDAAHTLLMMPDLFNFWFTGVKTGEFTNASTTQFYDTVSGDWARGLLARVGVPDHFLPGVVQPGTVLGRLRPSLLHEVDLPHASFIAPGTHDTASAVVAVPAVGDDFVYISSGTWSLMGIESSAPIITERAMEMNVTNEGGVGGTFRILKNVMGLWLIQACRSCWASSGLNCSFAELADMAEREEPFRAVVDPDDPAFLSPGDMPARICDYCANTGQPVPDTPASVARTIFDSLALKYRYVLECLEELSGRRLGPIHIVGGGSRNSLLCRITADVTGRTVIAGPDEATAVGNILVQAIALGHLSSIAEAREVVRKSFRVQVFEPKLDCASEGGYERLVGLISKIG